MSSATSAEVGSARLPTVVGADDDDRRLAFDEPSRSVAVLVVSIAFRRATVSVSSQSLHCRIPKPPPECSTSIDAVALSWISTSRQIVGRPGLEPVTEGSQVRLDHR